jgi:hypothetical protein
MPIGSYNPVPKPSARVIEKQRKRTEEASQLRACYKAVDERDAGRCRVCGKRGSPTAVGLLDRLQRHHMVYRSKGGEHRSENVLSVCAACHAAIHVDGSLRVIGDADVRDAVTGKLGGVAVWRLKESGWTEEKFV